MQQEIINAIALTRISYFNLAGILELYRRVGSASAIIEHRNNIRDIIPNASEKLANAFKNLSEPMKRAEAEFEYDMQNGIEPLCINSPRYRYPPLHTLRTGSYPPFHQ